MTDQPLSDRGVLPEVRTRRLVVVNEAGLEQGALAVNSGVLELRLGGSRGAMPCEATVFAGEQEAGTFSAGFELWVNGDSVAGCVVTVVGSQIQVESFGGRS